MDMLVTGRPFHLDFDDKYHPVDVEHQRAHVETCLYVTQRFSMNKNEDWHPSLITSRDSLELWRLPGILRYRPGTPASGPKIVRSAEALQTSL